VSRTPESSSFSQPDIYICAGYEAGGGSRSRRRTTVSASTVRAQLTKKLYYDMSSRRFKEKISCCSVMRTSDLHIYIFFNFFIEVLLPDFCTFPTTEYCNALNKFIVTSYNYEK
jgi:hypothetical protein